MDSPVLHKDCLQALLARDEEIRELRQTKDREIAGLREQLADHERSFDLRWKADMRAIKRWQEAQTGNDLVWPDHADLCVWLMEQTDDMRKQIASLWRIEAAAAELISEAGPITCQVRLTHNKLRAALEAK